MGQSGAWTRIVMTLALAVPAFAGAQQVERNVSVLSEDLAQRLDGFSYKEGPKSHLDFRGTPIALGANGEAEVEFQDGRAEIQLKVEYLPAPVSFGPFATYVLWAVTVDGHANNLGAIETRDGRGSLDATTPLSQFGLIVSAEPHFAVTAPSRAIVLQNLGKRVRGEQFNIAALKQRIDYSSLPVQSQDERRDVPSDLVQARYAVEIAEGADADRLVPNDFQKASQLLARAEAAQQDKKYSVRSTAPQLARDAIQVAEDTRRNAVVALAAEQRDAAQREVEQKAAVQAAAQAEEAQRREAEAVAATSAAARADLVARLNRALPTRDTPRGIVAELAGVEFATGSPKLGASARESLSRFAGIVGVYPDLRILVEGHTDSTGSRELNEQLSYERAGSVREYLAAQGVSQENIEVTGRGPDVPVASNDTAEGRARNRRVEIIISGDVGAPAR